MRARWFGLVLVCLTLQLQAQISIGDLAVEYQTTPLGLDVTQPRFSWKMIQEGKERGMSQIAYQLEVKDETQELVWNSDRVESGTSINIEYQGESLEPGTRYQWTVSVWDQKGKVHSNSSWFETGLLNSGMEAWDGAQWIGGTSEALVLYSHALSVFKVEYAIQIDKGSARAGLVLGANDRRLMNDHLNILGVENAKDESYLLFELDLTTLGKKEEEMATLNIYRAGYLPSDQANKPLHAVQIPKSLIHRQNQYEAHQFYLDFNFGFCQIFIDGHDQEHLVIPKEFLPSSPWVDVWGVPLNPHGSAGGDQLTYPVLGDIGFKMEKGQKARFSQLKIKNYREPSNTLFFEDLGGQNYAGAFSDQVTQGRLSIEDKSYRVDASKSEQLIIADPSQNAMPMLRTEFEAKGKKLSKARLYVTARGIYEMYLNGERVGDDYFNPGLTQYNKTHMYQTYDVTEMVSDGANALGAMLAEGWWSGNITYRGYNWNYFGDRQSLLAKLVLTYEDGATQTISTQPDSWTYYDQGPIVYSSFFQGEIYDANRESAVSGWSQVGFDDKDWKPAVEVPLEGTAFTAAPLQYDELKLIGQIGKNAGIVKELTAQSVDEVRPGVFVYDMGQNMVGVPKITLSGEKGDTVTMRYAEMKYPDLPEHKDYVGMIMMENIRGAQTTDRWILGETTTQIQPRFTFHGYRYLEITGIKAAIPLDQVKGLVISSIDELASGYETSNPLVNQLWSNITWSFRSNFLSIPTDTPARNERMGWNGDINVFARTATFLGDIDPFLNRHLMANRDLQAASGRFQDIAPIGTGFGGTLWGSAGIVLAWELYQQYGDLRLIEEHYDAMKAYVNFLETKQDAKTGILDEGPLGDWLSPEGYKNDNSLLWTAYQVYDLRVVYQSAELLGKTSDAKKYKAKHDERKTFFNQTYVDEATGKTIRSAYAGDSWAQKPEGYTYEKGDFIDTQVSYAVPLALDVFAERYQKRAAEHLAQAVSRKNQDFMGVERPEVSLMTGFIGTASLAPSLSEHGYDQLSYQLLQQTSYPSWLYSVENGATTIWERLNSYTKEEGFGGNNSMNSFNHYSFGAIGSWMYNTSLGIQRKDPGFKEFVLAPTPDPTGQMTWARGYYDSMYGKIVSEWRIEEDKVTYQITVPANTKARLYLLAADKGQVKESGKKLAKSKGLVWIGQEKDRVLLELSSGSYEFTVQ
ncbi:glycoside hydrolase family 78 protein [Reichenbachiella ulvae]|uniref:alpha-L-rhamnosidase n=1 Tax=Reichenbachiella ulvae TaxID=2980104 RepID=A0ABT3CUM8_9BACT|nr:glycoside hydrolase family 78 protein [Reichenbachiella ulvae]MCV9387400.1 glycoside hydrolase family 78 protein [Reichenbachiella ulvae]